MSGVDRADETLKACQELLDILKKLRAPGGCPWDGKQTEKSMAPLILEEAFELADAIAAGRPDKGAEETGDLLMNVFMTCLIAAESDRFTLEEAFRLIAAKLVRRHPHVFGEAGERSVEEVLHRWEDIKKGERRENGDDDSTVAGVPRAMPGLLRAYRVAEKLKRTGADLPPFREPIKRARELLDGMEKRSACSGESAEAEEALGELLLAICNAAALSGTNPETALRAAADREEKTFRRVEKEFGGKIEGASREEIDRSWGHHGGTHDRPS